MRGRTTSFRFHRRRVGNRVARQQLSDIFHGRALVRKKRGVPDFSSRGVRKKTDEELIEITASDKNKIADFEENLKASHI